MVAQGATSSHAEPGRVRRSVTATRAMAVLVTVMASDSTSVRTSGPRVTCPPDSWMARAMRSPLARDTTMVATKVADWPWRLSGRAFPRARS
jgi:hypothetical protein